jgi:hypothetical protein
MRGIHPVHRRDTDCTGWRECREGECRLPYTDTHSLGGVGGRMYGANLSSTAVQITAAPSARLLLAFQQPWRCPAPSPRPVTQLGADNL